MTLRTPIGDGVLVPTSFAGHEAMSEPFRFDLELLAEAPVDPGQLLGRGVSLVVDLGAEAQRTVAGVVAGISGGGPDPATGARRYRMEVVPWLWFLTATADRRIFQDASVPEIVGAVIGDGDAGPVRVATGGRHPRREYCVQYRESDLDFVSRLLEEEGIFYYFEQLPDGGLRLVLGDGPEALAPLSGAPVLPYVPAPAPGAPGAITGWQPAWTVTPGRVVLGDYDPLHPAEDLLVAHEIAHGHAHDDLEVYDFPGEYAVRPEGELRAQALMESLAAPHHTVHAASSSGRLAPGHTFALTGHSDPDSARQWVIVAVDHEVRGLPAAAPGDPGRVEWTNTFTCIPASVPFRPPRRTPKPVAAGVETAVVTGPAGEEVHTDRFGRVKVQFYWDRENPVDDTSSCWIRVGQPHAGQANGLLFLPEVGDEVLVAFVDGDPDRPIIVGSVYNADTVPPRNRFRPRPGR